MPCSITTPHPIRLRPARRLACRRRETTPSAASPATRERRREITSLQSTGGAERMTGCHRTSEASHDHADLEQVFKTYVQSINAAEVDLASQVWLQSPDIVIVTPVGRYKGWDSVRNEIYPAMQREFTDRNVEVSNVS